MKAPTPSKGKDVTVGQISSSSSTLSSLFRLSLMFGSTLHMKSLYSA